VPPVEAAKGEVDSRSVDNEVEYGRLKTVLTSAQIKEAEQNAAKLKASGNQEGLDFFASMGKQLSTLPAETRPMAYNQMLQSMQARHPNAQLPDYLKEYRAGETDTALMQLYAASLHSPKNQHEMDREQLQQTGLTERNDADNRTQLSVAGINQTGANTRNTQNIEAGKGIPLAAQKIQYQRVLADPKASPEAKAMAEDQFRRSIIEDESKLNKDDPILNAMAMKAMTDPNATVEYDKRVATKRIDRMLASGIDPSMYDLMAESPGVSPQVLRAAFKRKYNRELK